MYKDVLQEVQKYVTKEEISDPQNEEILAEGFILLSKLMTLNCMRGRVPFQSVAPIITDVVESKPGIL